MGSVPDSEHVKSLKETYVKMIWKTCRAAQLNYQDEPARLYF